jgi:hypothetical protein
MRGKLVLVGMLIAALVVGAAAGAAGASSLTASRIVSLWVNTNARDAEEILRVLEHLRAGRMQPALDELESHLNGHLFGLMPVAREGVEVSETALERASAVARLAREYRKRHPFSGKALRDEDVRRFLGEP